MEIKLPFQNARDDKRVDTPVTAESALAGILIELRAIRRLLRAGKPHNVGISYKKVDVPAGVGRVEAANISGTYFAVDTATAKFEMAFDDGEKFPANAGLAIQVPAGFTRITFFNLEAVATTVEFYAANVPIGFSGLIAG